MKNATDRAVGKIRFTVEWCVDLPANEFGDADVDRAKYKKQPFPELKDAIRFAQELIGDKKDAFGDVVVTREEARVDADLLEYEGVTRVKWFPEACVHVNEGPGEFDGEYELEPII